jgi:hypothetical protein
MKEFDEITIVADNNSEYELSNFLIEDSTISGFGKINIKEKETPFMGKIYLDSIKCIKGNNVSLGKTILTAGTLAAFLLVFYIFAKKEDGSQNNVHFYIPSGGSCNKYASENPGTSGISAAGNKTTNAEINPDILNAKIVNVIREKDVLQILISGEEIKIKRRCYSDELLFDGSEKTFNVDSRNGNFIGNLILKNGMNHDVKLLK